MHKQSYIFILLLLSFNAITSASAATYPITVTTITKEGANYLTPENTLSAVTSALRAGDISWADKALTSDYLEADIQDFRDAGLDRNVYIEMEKQVRETVIVDKVYYNDAVFLIIEDYGNDGSITRYPMTLIKEDGLWKITNKFSSDEIVGQYTTYTPPLFDGKGQKPSDTNLFLGYEQPTQAHTELPPGSDTYELHIYYGKTVDPSTFSAVLNKQNVSYLFTPAPFSGEEVKLPMHQGRNVLVVSIEGATKSGKIQKDTDRLVFIVP